MSDRPRLLFLAYFFPPLAAVGCIRAWNIAQYLARTGWEVTVVTPDPSLWRDRERDEEVAAELAREGIRRIATGHQWQCLSGCFNTPDHGPIWLAGGICRRLARSMELDPAAGWVPAAARACAGLRPGSVDLVLATGNPFCAFGLAQRLAARAHCPYVLDYRDPWTGNPHAGRPDRPAVVREEARLLAGCAATTIVSEAWAAALEARFHPGPRLHVVTNGYDPEALAAVRPHSFGHFAIVYTGRFYPPKRVIGPVMAALERLEARPAELPNDWRFHYYGSNEAHVMEAARQCGMAHRVVLHGQVSRQEALSAVRGAGLAVVITSVSERDTLEDQGIMTGKLFEPLGLGTPTLLIGPPGSDTEAVLHVAGLGRRFTGSDIVGIAAYLKEVMQGRPPRALRPETYSWPRIAQKMDRVLRAAIEAPLHASV